MFQSGHILQEPMRQTIFTIYARQPGIQICSSRQPTSIWGQRPAPSSNDGTSIGSHKRHNNLRIEIKHTYIVDVKMFVLYMWICWIYIYIYMNLDAKCQHRDGN